jgi:hypothetical protein
MDPNSSELPTPPSVPVPPAAQPFQPVWPTPAAGGRPPGQRPPWSLLAAIGAAIIVVLLIGLLFFTRGGGTTTVIGGLSPASQTATAASTQATASTGTQSTATTAVATPTATSPSSTATATTPPQPPSVEFIVAQATVSTGTPVVASCHSGELALSGGWASDGNTPIYNSSRSGNGWRVFPTSSGGALTNSYVMCLQNDPGASVTERLAHITVGAGTTGNADVACSGSEVVVGGGYANPDSSIEIYNFTAMGNGWGGYAVNHSASADVVTFYAECLTSPGAPHVSFTSPATTSVGGGSSGGTQVSCPSGSLLSGGGFADDENALVYNSSPNSSSTWETYLKNQGAASTGLNVYAMCLSLS